MASSVTKGLALGAALFGGLQAGVTANRAIVLLPAWERLGVMRGKRRHWGAFLSGAWPRRAALHGFRCDRASLGPHRSRFAPLSRVRSGSAGDCLGDCHARAHSPGDVRFAGGGQRRRATPANIHHRFPLVGSQRRPSCPYVRSQSVGAGCGLLQPPSQLGPTGPAPITSSLSFLHLSSVGG